MKKIEFECPECFKKRLIQIDEKSIKNSQRGLISINIINDQVCSHSFIAYLDNNYALRDTFTTDFTIELPKIKIKTEEINKKNIPKSDEINIDLIKLNIFPISFIFFLRCCFQNNKILILNDIKLMNLHLNNLFNYIFKDTFNINVFIKNREFYLSNKKEFKDFIVLDGKTIIRDKEKVLNQKKIKIEKSIIQKFFAENDSLINLIFLRNEINKAYELSKTIIELFKTLKKGEKININMVLEKLHEVYSSEISKTYLDFLIEIIKNYFQIKAPIIYENFLGFV